MSSFEDRFYLSNPDMRQVCRRNLRLLLDSARFFLLWATLGRRLRRQVKRAELEGSQVILEDVLGGGPK